MKRYLELYLSRYKNAGAAGAEVYKAEDFTDIETLIHQLPGRLRETPLSDRNKHVQLANFTNALFIEDLCEFMEDILYEDPVCTDTIFETTKYATPAENAFDWLMVLPYATLKKLEGCLESIFHRALHSSDPFDRKALSKIKSIVAYNKTGLSASFLMREFENTAVSEQLSRLESLILLGNLEESETRQVGELFWNSINLQEEPWLAPGVLSAYKYIAPEKALAVLRRVSPEYAFQDDKVRNMLRRSVETTLNQLLRRYAKEEARDRFEREVQALWAHKHLLEIVEQVIKQGVEAFEPFVDIMSELEQPSAIPTRHPHAKVDKSGIPRPWSKGAGESTYYRIGMILHLILVAHHPDEVDRILGPVEFDRTSKDMLMDRVVEEYDFGRIRTEIYQRVTLYLDETAERAPEDAGPFYDSSQAPRPYAIFKHWDHYTSLYDFDSSN